MEDEPKDVQTAKPHPDAFGVARDAEGKVVIDVPKQPDFVEVNGAKYVNDGTGKPKTDDKGNPLAYTPPDQTPAADDIEKNPVVQELRKQLVKSEEDKKSMGQSLSEQRKTFEARLEKLEKGEKTPKGEPVFKEIKRVKDLTKAEQDAMTDTEKTLFDKNADLMEAMNKMAENQQTETVKERQAREQSEAAAKEEREASEADAEFNRDVQSRVIKLAGNNVDVANKIIAEFNNFKDNHLLEDDEVDARIEKAAKLVPEYKPVKQQQTPQGGAVKAGAGADDPFGNKDVIKEAKAASGGQSYSL
jgi:hypothetical protein